MREGHKSDVLQLAALPGPPAAAQQAVPVALWGAASEKKTWRDRLEPVLRTPMQLSTLSNLSSGLDLGRLLAPLGGPPRQPRKVVQADVLSSLAVIPDGGSLLVVAEDGQCPSSRRLGRWPVKPDRKPLMPRMAVRRLFTVRGSSLEAITDGSSHPSKPSREPPRPVSPLAVSEAVFLRDLMGKDGAFYRGALDVEVAGRDAEFAELAQHRVDCQRAYNQQSREQAAKWRRHQEYHANLAEIRWLLQTNMLEPFRLPLQAGLPDYELVPIPTPVNSESYAQHSSQQRKRSRLEDDPSFGQGVTSKAFSRDSSPRDKPEGTMLPGDVAGLMKQRNPSGNSPSELKRKSNRTERLERLDKGRRSKISQPAVGYSVSRGNLAPPTLQALRRASQGGGQVEGEGEHCQASVEAMSSVKSLLRAGMGGESKMKHLGKLSDNEVKAYRNVFDQYDSDGSNSLDGAELRCCLQDLGLQPRNEAEREEVRAALRSVTSLEVSFTDFIMQIIPKVRTGLAELRKVQIQEYFKEADDDNSGTLSVMELVRICRRMGSFPGVRVIEEAILEVIPGVADDLHSLSGKLLMEKNVVTLPFFELLLPVLQERTQAQLVQRVKDIARSLNLSEEQRELWNTDLGDLYDSFLRFADPKMDQLPVFGLAYVSQDVGMLPKKKGLRAMLLALAKSEVDDEDDPLLEFSQVFRILSKVRMQECQRIRDLFSSHDANSTGGLSVSEAQRCLQDCGVVSKTKKESQEVASLIEEFDVDGSGELDQEEFVGLVKFVVERLRKLRREEERDKVFAFGWTEDDHEEYRVVFTTFDDDLSTFLEGEEVTNAIEKVRENWRPEEAEKLLKEMGILPSTAVDFITFIEIIKAIDDREYHRRLGAAALIDRETVENLCVQWRALGPVLGVKDGDTVNRHKLAVSLKNIVGSPEKLKRLNNLVPFDREKVGFELFLQLMKRGDSTEALKA